MGVGSSGHENLVNISQMLTGCTRIRLQNLPWPHASIRGRSGSLVISEASFFRDIIWKQHLGSLTPAMMFCFEVVGVSNVFQAAFFLHVATMKSTAQC